MQESKPFPADQEPPPPQTENPSELEEDKEQQQQQAQTQRAREVLCPEINEITTSLDPFCKLPYVLTPENRDLLHCCTC